MADITCDFVVRGHNFDPAVLTEALGVQPTLTWREGEQIQRTILRHGEDGWLLSSGRIRGGDLPEAALPLLGKVRPLAEKLNALTADLHLETRLAFTVAAETARTEDGFPGMYFSREVLDLLHLLGASLDIDVYV